MAENELEQEGGEETQDEKPSSGKKKWIIIALALLLLVVVSVVGTLYLLGSFDEPEEVAEEASEQTAEAEPELQPAIYYPMKPEFTTNYTVRGRQRYLQLHVTLMLRDRDVVSALELHMPALRNTMVMLLRNQDYQELQTPEGKELLRQQALLKIQEVLEKEIGKPGIEQVLFTNMVLQ